MALLQIAVSVAIGSSPVCLDWSAGRALATGATEDETTEVLLAIAPWHPDVQEWLVQLSSVPAWRDGWFL